MVRIRSAISALTGYKPGRQPSGPGWIKLNTNEAFEASPAALQAVQSATVNDVRLYPSPSSNELKHKLAEHYAMSPDQVVVGNGSDDILNLIVRTCCEMNDKLVTTNPAYSLYPILSSIQDVNFEAIPCKDDFALDIDKIIGARGQITLITSPNNPAGTSYDPANIRLICESGANLVVVDEAYAEFANQNALDLLCEFENLCVVRTFSKAYGLAGLRVGYLLGHEGFCAQIQKVKDSYNVNRIAQIAAIAALSDQEWAHNMWDTVRQRRTWLTDQLGKIQGLSPHPSQANFVLVDCGEHNASQIYNSLEEKHMLVRYLPDVRGAENSLRITIGTQEELDILVNYLQDIVSGTM